VNRENKRGRRSSCRRGRHAVHIAEAPAVSLSHVTVLFNDLPVLTDVSFELETGLQLSVVGPNGAGKSTLVRVIAGLLPPSQGTVRIHGYGPWRHICIAYVPQKTQIDWRFPVTVTDVVMMGRLRRTGPFHRPRASDRAIVQEALTAVDLLALAGRQIAELSGGQQQRMFIARALAQQAELILLDEPFTGLDTPSKAEVLALIGMLRDRGVTVVVALHDLAVAAEAFDRVLLLNGRTIGFGLPDAVFTEENVQAAYRGCLHIIPGENGPVLVHDSACTGGHDEHV